MVLDKTGGTRPWRVSNGAPFRGSRFPRPLSVSPKDQVLLSRKLYLSPGFSSYLCGIGLLLFHFLFLPRDRFPKVILPLYFILCRSLSRLFSRISVVLPFLYSEIHGLSASPPSGCSGLLLSPTVYDPRGHMTQDKICEVYVIKVLERVVGIPIGDNV